VHPKALPMAERAVLAHLQKLEADNLVKREQDDIYAAQNLNLSVS
jgi:hypothetical protein